MTESLPSPLKPLACNNPDCTLPTRPKDGRCALAQLHPEPLLTCPDLKRQEPAPEPRSTVAVAETGREVAWTGRPLGLDQFGGMLGASPARLIGIFGHHDAGKTTWVASLFLQMANGALAQHYRFASSRTLLAWHEMTQRALEWNGSPQANVVPHTVYEYSKEAEIFLHLGLVPVRHPDRCIDVVLTDIPGEWGERWATLDNEVHQERLAYLDRCDAFALVLDAQKLRSSEGGVVVSQLRGLLRRLLMRARDRRYPCRAVAILLSKYDLVLKDVGTPPAPEDALDLASWGDLGVALRPLVVALEQVREHLGATIGIFALSAFPGALDTGQPVGVVEPFLFLMAQTDVRASLIWPSSDPPSDAHPFLLMGRG